MSLSRVIAVGTPRSFSASVAHALDRAPTEIEWIPDDTAIAQAINGPEGPPAVLVISPRVGQDSALGIASLVTKASPTTAVILVRDQVANGLLPAAMRAGVRDVVDLASGEDGLAPALSLGIAWSESIRASREAHDEEEGDHGLVVSVFSSKGGTGKTFLSCNLAAAAATRSGLDVALVDLDFGMGDVFSYFGAKPSRPIQDLLTMGERANEKAIRAAATELSDHLYGFGAPPDLAAAESITGTSVAGMIRALRGTFAVTVIDSTATYSDAALTTFDHSDVICLITGLDVVGIKHLSKAMETLVSIGVPRERLRIVLNRADSKVGLEVKDVEKVLGVGVDAMIPSSRLVPSSLNTGRPVYYAEPRSPVARSVEQLADKLLDAVAVPQDVGSRSKRRLFGRG